MHARAVVRKVSLPGDLGRVGGRQNLRLDGLPDAALRRLLAARALLHGSHPVRALHCRNYDNMSRSAFQAHTAHVMQDLVNLST